MHYIILIKRLDILYVLFLITNRLIIPHYIILIQRLKYSQIYNI